MSFCPILPFLFLIRWLFGVDYYHQKCVWHLGDNNNVIQRSNNRNTPYIIILLCNNNNARVAMNKWLHVILLFARYYHEHWAVNIVNGIFMVIENSLKIGIDYLEAGTAMKSSSVHFVPPTVHCISAHLKLAYWHPRSNRFPNEFWCCKTYCFFCLTFVHVNASFRLADKRGWNNWKS